jgi:hypothetical protein
MVEDIPDVKTFLERIGRDAAKECEDKITVLSPLSSNAHRVDLGSFVQSEWQVFESKRDSCAVKTVHLTADRQVSVCPSRGLLLMDRKGEEIKHIRRGKKINGGERRKNQVVTKTKIGR